MATEKHGILGQQAPGAAANADLIPAVAAGRKVTISSITVANTSGSITTYRINARIAGAAAAVGNQIAPDVSINPGSADIITAGIALGPTDVLTVRSAGGGVTFTAFGVEEDLV